MPVTIASLVASGPVLVPLSTGTTVRLSPGEVSDELPDVEVANNAKVEKLRRQGLIAVLDPESGTDAPAAEEPAEQQDGPRAAGRSRTRSRARSEPSG
jgi:hypothetical protein